MRMRDVIKSARKAALENLSRVTIEQLDLQMAAHPYSFSHDARYPTMRALYLQQAEEIAVLREQVRRLEKRS